MMMIDQFCQLSCFVLYILKSITIPLAIEKGTKQSISLSRYKLILPCFDPFCRRSAQVITNRVCHGQKEGNTEKERLFSLWSRILGSFPISIHSQWQWHQCCATITLSVPVQAEKYNYILQQTHHHSSIQYFREAIKRHEKKQVQLATKHENRTKNHIQLKKNISSVSQCAVILCGGAAIVNSVIGEQR